MTTERMTHMEEALLEEEEFYKVALDPALEQLDIGVNYSLDELLSDDINFQESEKRNIQQSPWRKSCYDPYHSPPIRHL